MTAGRLQTGGVFAEKFRVERPLAEGGMGELYVVTNLATGHLCALKLLGAEGCFDDAIRARFLDEARRTPSDASDHIVKVLDAGVAEGRPWILMELLDGATLQEHVTRHGPLSCEDLRMVFAQLCHGLAAAHARALVHRDLKPENVFLQRPKSAHGGVFVKVLDFGIAKTLDPRRASGTASIAIGTEGWWAPEQVIPGAALSSATDVWALGLLAYWCLAGRPFHEVETPSSQMLATASARAREQGVGERIPPAFDAWFAQCVAWDPAQRFADAGAAWRALEAALTRPAALAPTMPAHVTPAPYVATPTPPPAVMQTPTRRVQEPRRPGGLLILSALLGAVGVASFGGWWLLRGSSTRPDGGAPTYDRGSSTLTTASTRRSLYENPDLRAFFGRWDQALAAIARGEGANVGPFYAEQIRFRGSTETVRTRAGVDAYWTLFFRGYQATIRFDWSRAEQVDEPLDPSRAVHSACLAMSDAEPGVTLVRVPAVEDNAQNGIATTDGMRCTHIEGVYLLRVRRSQGSYQLCHDSWSLDEAICRSCPNARDCVRR